MKLALVTGVSRGLGEATAKLLLDNGIHVVGVSRSTQDFQAYAEKRKVTYTHLSKDLSELKQVKAIKEKVREICLDKNVSELYLVNNAAVLQPIDQAMNYTSEDFAFHVQVNTIAPIVLMNGLLKFCHEKKIKFTGTTVTSGAAERPVYGWSAYCSTKASINMYTETVGLEQEEINSGNKVFAFSPGIMDTNMQAEIRSSSKEEFVEVETFRNYKETNQLREPREVAEVFVNILLSDEVENGKIYYVRDYL